MVGGSVIAVLSNDEAKAVEIAERLGKREGKEEGVFYRRREGAVRTVLVPRRGDLLKAAESLTLSTYYYLYVGEINAEAAELALLASASGVPGRAMALDAAAFRKYFGELGLEPGEFEEVDRQPEDLGYVYVEKAFNVRGVGPVAIGLAYTGVKVHDKLVALPSGAEVDVKSIQVLDEDQEEVAPGARVGLALRGIEADQLKEAYALVKKGVPLRDRLKAVKLKWAAETDRAHAFLGGIKALAAVKGQEAALDRKIPATLRRGVLVNVNAKPRTPRVYGYLEAP
ncbi:MAG: translation elongation factor [Thermoproteus sp.]